MHHQNYKQKLLFLMKKSENIIVGISIGDLNGIGSEIILKTFEDSRMLEFCTPVIFASAKSMNFFKTHFNSEINFNGINNLNQLVFGKVNVLNFGTNLLLLNLVKKMLK